MLVMVIIYPKNYHESTEVRVGNKRYFFPTPMDADKDLFESAVNTLVRDITGGL